MGRTLRVLDSPEDIIPDRPQKPVRGRAARIAAMREARQSPPTGTPATPRRVGKPVEVAEPGPIVWAKPNPVYHSIPYCLD